MQSVDFLRSSLFPTTLTLLSVLKRRGIYMPHDFCMYLGVSGMQFRVRFPTQMHICHLHPSANIRLYKCKRSETHLRVQAGTVCNSLVSMDKCGYEIKRQG